MAGINTERVVLRLFVLKHQFTIDKMPNLVASRKHKSRNGTEIKKLVEAVERDTLAKLLKEHTAKTPKAMLCTKSLDSNGSRKELILRLCKSLEKNQIAKIEQREENTTAQKNAKRPK